jgi:hypothetical protein
MTDEKSNLLPNQFTVGYATVGYLATVHEMIRVVWFSFCEGLRECLKCSFFSPYFWKGERTTII